MLNKRGLSAVVTTLMIILLVLVAIGIIWIVIRNVITSGTEEISLTKFSLDLKIENAIKNSNQIEVIIKRNPGKGELKAISFIISEEKKNIIVQLDANDLEELESTKFTIPNSEYSSLEIEEIQEISIAPVFESDSGKELVGEVLDTYKFSDSSIFEEVPPEEGCEYCAPGQCGGDNGCGGTCANTCSEENGFTCGENNFCREMNCNERNGDTCELGEMCPGNPLDALDPELCCDETCVSPEWDLCSECGNGFFNFFCDEAECNSISEGCYYNSDCLSCSTLTCTDYVNEDDCSVDRCDLDCSWNGDSCVEIPFDFSNNVLFLKMDDGVVGNAKILEDSSSNNFDCTIFGDVDCSVAGPSEKSCYFSNSNYVKTPSLGTLNQQVSVSTWAKINAGYDCTQSLAVFFTDGFSVTNGVYLNGLTCNQIVFKGYRTELNFALQKTLPSEFNPYSWNHYVAISNQSGLLTLWWRRAKLTRMTLL